MRALVFALLLIASGAGYAQADGCARGGGTCVRFPTHATQLYRAFTQLRELAVDFYTDSPAWIETAGHVEFATRYATSMGIATKIAIRCVSAGESLPAWPITRAPSPAYPEPTLEQWIPGGKSGQNILSMEHHYGRTLLSAPRTLVGPGLCRVEVWGSSHTSAAGFAYVDGLAHVNVPTDPAWGPYGFFQVRVRPAN